MEKKSTYIVPPKYKLHETVSFIADEKLKVGLIEYIDTWGTFEQAEEPSYDVFVRDDDCLYKHISESKIFPYKTFDNYLVNKTNRDAYGLALLAAEECGAAVNPLFIHGKSGMGKTHLAMAIKHEVGKNPDMKIEVLTCEDLTNRIKDFWDHKDERACLEFYEEFEHLDLLILEDVDLLEGKLGTQQMVGHMIRHLCEGRRKKTQVVLTAAEYKKDGFNLFYYYFLKLKDHAVMEIEDADEELKRACIQTEADSLNISVSKRVADAIVQKLRDPGSIFAVLRDAKAYATIFEKPLDDTLIWRVVDIRSRVKE